MKIRVFAAAFFLMTVLSGCDGRLEVRDRAFVQSAGIEYENGEYIVCLRLFDSDESYTGRGKSFEDAVNNAESLQGKDFFTGHTEIVSVRENERMTVLESLINEDVSSGCLVVTDDNPLQFVSINDPETVKGVISTAERNGIAEKINICDVINGR